MLEMIMKEQMVLFLASYIQAETASSNINKIPKDKKIIVFCATGSMAEIVYKLF